MINKLTLEQEAKVEVYLEKWKSNGYDTSPIDRTAAAQAVIWLYNEMLEQEKPEIIFCDSPEAVMVEGVKRVGEKFRENWANYYHNAWWTWWVGFYDFCLNELFPEKKEEFKQFLEFAEKTRELHMMYPFEGTCFVVERPIRISVNTRGDLHNTETKALEYKDGFGFYCLNGRKVPEWVVTEDPKTWTKEKIFSETNTEVRREIIRKLGILQAVSLMGAKVIHAKDYSGAKHFLTHEGRSYELLEADFGTGGVRKYLKMKNASVSDYHIEAVHPDCKTVDQALGYREELLLGEKWKEKGYKYVAPEILT